MKFTTIFCSAALVFFGICAAVYALFSFDLLSFLCLGNVIAYRAVLSFAGVSAIWLLFWLIAFRPTKYLS